ncbi:MAG: polysaccharide biosynthesis/export family protein, partial [Pseudomonadota bacterium]|nr:polysaccharide biosynthesis/export family protein [Pseudomonadota bacterium]
MKIATKDYRIGPEDLIEIQVFGVDQLTRTVRVNSRGLISLPLIGNLEVGGLTSQQAEALVVAKLAENFLQNPQVSFFIREYTSQRVTIEGAVNKPGVYP